MSLLEWTNDLNTGIDWVDAQHQQIVQYINDLHDARVSGQTDRIGGIIDQLVDYTVTHFAEEEAMMAKAGYPLTEAHQGVHTRFVDKVGSLRAQHHAGFDMSEQLLNLLEGWLFTHIRVNDQGYVPTVQEALQNA